MGSAHHAFAALAGDQCERKMPDGRPCGRLPGSHARDLRVRPEDRHLGRHARSRNRGRPPQKTDLPFVFWDDEGKGEYRWTLFREPEAHRLIYGAAVDEHGKVILEVESADGRSQPPPEVWLDALLEVGRRTKQRSIFAYGFGYDRTKILEGLPPKILYQLTHREERPRSDEKAKSPIPLYWGDYQLDLQGSRFSVAKLRRLPDGRPMKNMRGKRLYDRVTVWDVLKFFQCPFVDALDAWRRKVARNENLSSLLEVPDDELDHMRLMKTRRAEFDRMPWEEVKRYCQSECRYGARLVRELVTACAGIGVTLRRFDGAGSISDALMRNNGVAAHMSQRNISCRWVLDSVRRRQLTDAVMRAFFGGRFETAYCGVVRRDVYEKDIASAYPYAMYLHPCLACGRWRHVRGRAAEREIERGELALVSFESRGRDGNQAFGSLPNRDEKGNITFPLDNRGWCWRPELLAARDEMGDEIHVREAFVYSTDCDHRPFKFMAELYMARLEIGKEGRGIAMKLGYNGCAGKTMQRVGSARWQEYIWAGNTTSRTRAQLLSAMARFRDRWDVAYVATDSIFALRDVALPEPERTGTESAPREHRKPPLGGWEATEDPYRGMCFVRPGIAFPLNATEKQRKKIKARGISKSALLDNVDRVVELMAEHQTLFERAEPPRLSFDRRIFLGMKMSVHKREGTYHVADNYGQWEEQRVTVKLAAQPKRLARMPGEEGLLLPWPRKPESVPYRYSKRSAEARELEKLQDVLLEQPNLDMADFRE